MLQFACSSTQSERVGSPGGHDAASGSVLEAVGVLPVSVVPFARRIRAPSCSRTVTVRGAGRGGRNVEFLLALAVALEGEADIWALAADTDGIDGTGDNAGAIVTPDTLARGERGGLDAGAMLADNDGYSFFKNLGDLVMTGPTLTNVNDFRAILVLPR